jgi:succinate dehydrogenase / fumarate reductase cytochrome b subunit
MAVAALDSKTSYILDKLQSLSGIVPIGAFLAEHIWSNSYALVSPAKYNDISRELQQVPWRIFVETAVLWLPLLFHSFYGFYIWWKGKSNIIGHPWMSNWMYTLQRWTGLIAFAFIAWHLYTQRFEGHGVTSYADVQLFLQNPLNVTFYIIGIAAASFHLGNGLWNFACKWGIAVSVRSQRAFGLLGAAVGIGFTLAGIAIVIGMHYGAFPLGGYVGTGGGQ